MRVALALLAYMALSVWILWGLVVHATFTARAQTMQEREMSWYDRSRAVIGRVHETIPANATLAERRKALRNAYPFGQRAYFPYKAWCRAQREYLAKFAPLSKQLPPDGLFAPPLDLTGERT